MNRYWMVILFFPMVLQAQSVKVSPAYETVLESFFQKYQVQAPARYYLRFEKCKEGWYATHLVDGYKPGERELFFDASTGQFLPLKSFKKSYSGDSDQKNDFLIGDRYNTDEFGRQPFYGYEGWYNDVIALNGKRSKLADWEMESLARAYQNLQSAYIGIGGSYLDSADQFALKPGMNALSDAQVRLYLQANEKETQTYAALAQRSPDYATPVGLVSTKLANAHVHCFLILLQYQNEQAALASLPSGLYDPYLLQSAKNLLNSCPPDAILFTWGDSDTYPLYYLQAREHFRTDVIIANLSLLVTPRYNAMIRKGPLGAKPLQTLMPDCFYKEMMGLYSYGTPSGTSLENFDQVLAYLRDSSNFSLSNGLLMGFISVPMVAIAMPDGLPSLGVSASADTIVAYNRDGNLFSDGLSQMDLLVANKGQRPLCFSLTCSEEALERWNGHLALEGVVYRLYPDSLDWIESMGEGTVSMDIGYELWTKIFDLGAETKISHYDKLPYFTTTWLAGFRLAEALYENDQQAKALEIAGILEQKFSNNMLPWGSNWVSMVNFYGKCGELAAAERIANVMLDNMDENKDSEEDQSARSGTTERLLGFARQYQMTKLEKRCSKMLKKVE